MIRQALDKLDKEIRAELTKSKDLSALVAEAISTTKKMSDKKAAEHIRSFVQGPPRPPKRPRQEPAPEDVGVKKHHGDPHPAPEDIPSPSIPEDVGVNKLNGDEPAPEDVPSPMVLETKGESKPSTPAIVEAKFKTYYTHHNMCCLMPAYKASVEANPPSDKVKKTLELVDDVNQVRGSTVWYLGRFCGHNNPDPKMQRAYEVMTNTPHVTSIQAEKLEKPSTCYISKEKVRKGQCYQVTMHMPSGQPLELILSEYWLGFVKHWVCLNRQVEFVTRYARGVEEEEISLQEKAKKVLAEENVAAALSMYKMPLKYFYSLLPESYQQELCRKHERHWFE